MQIVAWFLFGFIGIRFLDGERNRQSLKTYSDSYRRG